MPCCVQNPLEYSQYPEPQQSVDDIRALINEARLVGPTSSGPGSSHHQQARAASSLEGEMDYMDAV